MDARDPWFVQANHFLSFLARSLALAALIVLLLVIVAAPAFAGTRGGVRTDNFIVNAPTPELAREIAQSAEEWRKKLAIEWVGRPMPNWTEPCKLVAKVHPQLGAGGATTFVFDWGEVFGWEMEIQGSRERVLDSVLPHEITHTVFASYFRKPLPRWADEGACTTVEHRSEINKQERLLKRFLMTGKGIPFQQMFAMTEYPPDVLPLYAQGHSLTQYLLERRGKETFMRFLEQGMTDNNWRGAVASHYGHESLWHLQESWNDWVRAGRPRLELDADIASSVAEAPQPAASEPAVIRGQGDARPAPRTAGPPSVYSVVPKDAKPIRDASTGPATVWR